MPDRPIYLDHAATTPVRPEVLEAMLPYLSGAAFGNPSSSHQFGRIARAGLEQARREVAEAVGADPAEVVFTSGGTESDNLAVVGASMAARAGGHSPLAVVTALEHKAVLAAAHAVRGFGGEEAILPVDRHGLADLAALDLALASRPSIVSVMWVNNETGILQPIADVAARCAAAGVPCHSDAVQALGKVPVDLRTLPLSLLSISGHKIGAPKGIGALILRPGVNISPGIHGGGQQHGVRPGTENIAGAVGLGRAAQLAAREQASEGARLGALRDDLAARLQVALPDMVIHGEGGPRAPHILSVAVPGTDSEALLMHLDLAGVAASSGSACMTGAVEPSHVLTAMGVPRALAVGTIRFSLGRTTTDEDVDRVAAVFPVVATRGRQLAGVLGRG